jgi:hypothetical protein
LAIIDATVGLIDYEDIIFRNVMKRLTLLLAATLTGLICGYIFAEIGSPGEISTTSTLERQGYVEKLTSLKA